jgi:D-alanyl-D-alanine carboxypeptidase/D-alanyl-D-alanine-endopeptidase (penicillin-binding protein 4)
MAFPRFCLALLGALLLALPAMAESLPPSVARALKQAGIPPAAAGIYVREAGAPRPALALNAGEPMNPASVMKLLTTYAALELLGPAYTWRTEVYGTDALRGDTLEGDLVIKGYGDPKLNLENFWLLTRRLRLTGLRDIRGDLVLDASYFAVAGGDPGAFDKRPFRAYNVPPEALLVNYRVINLTLAPDPERRGVRVTADPVPAPLHLVNNLRLTQAPCDDWRGELKADIRPGPEPALVALNGSYSANCGEKSYLLALFDSERYAHGLFRELWSQQGGSFEGGVRQGEVPAGARLLLTHTSPPLTEVVRDVNKFSNNVMARQLFLALGAEYSGPPATLEKSRAALQQWLQGKGLRFPELVMENGSGLSRTERISAAHLGELLLSAFASPVMPEFMASLPVSGVDGTMKKRMNGSGIAGQAHIKTGLLEGVRTMAGYVLDARGRRVVVVALVNHPNAGAAEPVLDALLEWVYARPGPKGKP